MSTVSETRPVADLAVADPAVADPAVVNRSIAEQCAKLQRQVRTLRFAVLGLPVAMLALALAPSSHEEVIRARGIVIVDQEGRDRILIGAPLPDSKSRSYAKLPIGRFDETEKKWVADPKAKTATLTNGLVVLDENGIDRLAVGDPLPQPRSSDKIWVSDSRRTGYVIQDEKGVVRSSIVCVEKGNILWSQRFPNSEVSLGLWTTPDEETYMDVGDPDGKRRGLFGLGKQGDSMLKLLDAKENIGYEQRVPAKVK